MEGSEEDGFGLGAYRGFEVEEEEREGKLEQSVRALELSMYGLSRKLVYGATPVYGATSATSVYKEGGGAAAEVEVEAAAAEAAGPTPAGPTAPARSRNG